MDIGGFVSSLEMRKHSPATIAAYRRELTNFERFLKQKRLRTNQVTGRVIIAYLEHCDPEHRLKPASVRRRLACLSTYLAWVEFTSNGRIRNAAKLVRAPKRQRPRPRPADPQVVERLLAGIDNERDLAIIRLFLASGIRLSELCSLDRGSFSIEVTEISPGVKRMQGVARIIGKGDKERDILVDIGTLGEIYKYLQHRGDDGIGAMFISRRAKRISPRTVEHLLRHWCIRLGLPPIHPHQLRSRFSTDLYRLGMPTLELSRLIGHESLATTMAYLQPDLQRMRAEYFATTERLAMETQHSTSAPADAAPGAGAANSPGSSA
jgi:integrase/recombinase XerC